VKSLRRLIFFPLALVAIPFEWIGYGIYALADKVWAE
jgi:hypothetical protein